MIGAYESNNPKGVPYMDGEWNTRLPERDFMLVKWQAISTMDGAVDELEERV